MACGDAESLIRLMAGHGLVVKDGQVFGRLCEREGYRPKLGIRGLPHIGLKRLSSLSGLHVRLHIRGVMFHSALISP